MGERLTFPIRWQPIKKMNLKKGLNKLNAEDRIVVDTVIELTLELWDINKILGLALFLVFTISSKVSHVIATSHSHI